MVRTVIYTVALAVSITTFSLSVSSLLKTNWVTFHTPTSSPISIRTTYGLFQTCTASHIDWIPGSHDNDRDAVTCRKFPTKSQDCRAVGGGRGIPSPALELEVGVLGGVGRLGKVRVGLVGGRREERKRGEREEDQVVETEEARKRMGKEKKKPGAGSGGGGGGEGEGDDEDDDDDNWSFCDSWVTAGFANQLALAFGAASMLSSLIVAMGGRHKRETGWRIVSGFMTLHAACLIVAMSLVAFEFNNSDRFYSGARLGAGFIMATTAWALDVLVVFALVLIGATNLLKEDNYRPLPDH